LEKIILYICPDLIPLTALMEMLYRFSFYSFVSLFLPAIALDAA
jgi:hypothetical protein